MTSIKYRVLQIADFYKVKKEDFFDDLGLSYANFKGKQKNSALSSDSILLILDKYPNISVEWLVLGKGKITKSENSCCRNQYRDDLKVFFEESFEYVDLNSGAIEKFYNDYGNVFYYHPSHRVEVEVIRVCFNQVSKYLEVLSYLVLENATFDRIRFSIEGIYRGCYVGFQNIDESMNGGLLDDTPFNAEILGKRIDPVFWAKINKSKFGYIVVTDRSILHRDIEIDTETNIVKLIPRNKNFNVTHCLLNEVLQLFEVVKRHL